MAENPVIKTTLPDGRIQLERAHIDLIKTETKVPLWTDIADDFTDHLIIENGGIKRGDVPYGPDSDSKIIEGAGLGRNEIYGGHTAIGLDGPYIEHQSLSSIINRNWQAITGGYSDDKVYADKFGTNVDITEVGVALSDLQKGRPDIPEYVLKSLFPNGVMKVPAGDDNVIQTYNGNDYIEALHGNNFVLSGNGADTIKLGNGDNFVDTGGNDLSQDFVEVGNGFNSGYQRGIFIGPSDEVKINGGFNSFTGRYSESQINVTIPSGVSYSENTVHINNSNDPSNSASVFISGAQNPNIKFGGQIGGVGIATPVQTLTFTPDMAEFKNVKFAFKKQESPIGGQDKSDDIAFTITGQRENGENVTLGSGFVVAANYIAIKTAENGVTPISSINPREILALNGAEKSVTITK